MGSFKSFGLGICALLFCSGVSFGQNALSFDGTNDAVSFGDASQTPELGLAEFTIEFWFQRSGTGQTANTGTGGFVGIPLVTKGRGEAENSNLDMNYFVGIRDSDDVIAADFEEAGTGPEPGLNHPVFGTTTISNGVWYHVAATYDGSDWNLYLNGQLDGTVNVGREPRADSIQHFGVGTAFNSSGSASGRFQGIIDEVRVWDRALSQSEILAGINSEITSASGLVGRWGLNEGSGTTAADSSGNANDGTVDGASWVGGSPFDANLPPNAATLVMPANGADGIGTDPTLEVNATDPDGDTMDVAFFGRQIDGEASENFAIVAMPDTQFYACGANCSQNGDPATFSAQTQWALDQLNILNVAFVTQLGDCVQNGDNGGDDSEWLVARDAFAIIEDPIATNLTDGIPFGIAVGNHDQSPIANPDGTTTFYNQYFGEAHFAGRAYYGGHYGSNNDNSFQLFSAGGIDFIILHLEYDTTPDAAVLSWADGLLQTYSNRKAIVTAHYLLESNGAFSTQGQAVYDALKANDNLFLMLCGHVHEEARRSDTFNGNEVHTLLSDYQSRSNGGDGWLRILQFDVQNNSIDVKTYSPTLDQFESDSNSEFTLTYSGGGFASEFQQIGSTQLGVLDGANASVVWPSLPVNKTFEWYVEVSDATGTTQSATWSFSTACTSDADCNDDNGCTHDSCNTNGICEYTNTNGFCDDGNDCTDDACSNGVCESTPNTDPCDDGDLCTEFDACAGGACAGSPVSCDPGDVCNPGSGLCATPITVSFQQGASGYSGNVDTYLADDATTTDFSGATTLVVDLVSEDHILMRFDDIYGGGAGLIPPGATILSADLTINVTNESSGVGASLYRMLQPWNDTDTWDTWGGGIQNDGIEAATTPDASGSSGVGPYTLDVTTSIETWLGDPSTNHGWAWLPPAQDNSWQFDSAEAATVSDRPLLEVVYLPMGCVTPADCDDADDCTDDICDMGTCSYDPIPNCCVDAGDCDDADPCTTDTCDAQQCVNTPIPNCCVSEDDCDDGTACTIDLCVPGNVAALTFDGVDDQVTMGEATDLATEDFTVECWFRRTGAGDTVSTGNGGLTGGDVAIPLVTKGRGEAEGDNRDMNYFLGIHAANGMLAADFEEHSSGSTPGLNHPVIADTPISDTDWHHAAITYDGSCWQVYLDGVDDNLAANCPNEPPNFISIQHFALGTAQNSTGSSDGRLQGSLDEVRVWNHARTPAEIADGMGRQIVTSNGLIGRWSLNEGSGDYAFDSTSTGAVGVITGATWATSDIVDFGGGVCQNSLIEDCCDGAADCDDGDACTTDECALASVSALEFDGSNDGVSMGTAPLLGAAQFTLEAWIKPTGSGLTASSGSGGIVAVPIVAKGRGEADGDNRDMNYFMGIDGTSSVLTADFESVDPAPNNFPVSGTTAIDTLNVWYHVAATYDGATWRLYLNGVLDGSNTVNRTPRFDSIQHFSLGTAQTSTGSSAGRFEGLMDEVRVWNYARSESAIQATMNIEIESAPGLIGRWGMNESAGGIAFDSAGNANDGAIDGATYVTDSGLLIGFNDCSNESIPDCCEESIDCDDGLLCTIDICSNAVCENVQVDCSHLDDTCNIGVCNPGDGLCEIAPANEGGTCDDQDDCTVGDACTNGLCEGTFEDCDGDGVCDVDDNCPSVANPGQDPAACNGPFDFDHDGDVDSDDFAVFAECLAGPGVLTPPGGCSPGDFTDADQDSDGDVDLDDFALLQLEFTGTIASPCD
ncbi:MAG TPA: DNRLRE domain-containing protein [Phycisphaerae bacterium]|nr:DNRLRE domain-containing protein [Phycisphaerae bacterium]